MCTLGGSRLIVKEVNVDRTYFSPNFYSFCRFYARIYVKRFLEKTNWTNSRKCLETVLIMAILCLIIIVLLLIIYAKLEEIERIQRLILFKLARPEPIPVVFEPRARQRLAF